MQAAKACKTAEGCKNYLQLAKQKRFAEFQDVYRQRMATITDLWITVVKQNPDFRGTANFPRMGEDLFGDTAFNKTSGKANLEGLESTSGSDFADGNAGTSVATQLPGRRRRAEDHQDGEKGGKGGNTDSGDSSADNDADDDKATGTVHIQRHTAWNANSTHDTLLRAAVFDRLYQTPGTHNFETIFKVSGIAHPIAHLLAHICSVQGRRQGAGGQAAREGDALAD